MSKKLKIIISVIIVTLISAPIFFKKEKVFLEAYNFTSRSNIKTSIINIKNNNVLYMKCKFKNAGVLHNASDKHGISAVLSYLMFRKIKGLSPEETSEKMLELGLKHFTVNAFEDDFEVSFYVLKDKAEEALQFISGAFHEPEFSKNDLEFTKEIFPIKLDIDTSSPEALLIDKLMNMLYVKHRYGLNNTGTAQAVSSIKFEDIYNFVKSKFAKNSLEVIFAGDVSKMDAEQYLDAAFSKLRTECDANIEEKINPDISKEQSEIINKVNMGDIVGVMTGIRIDDLTDEERTAAYIIVETLFDNKIGDFNDGLRKANIAYKANHFSLKRVLSNVFYISIFINKEDLRIYLSYLDKKISEYNNRLNLKKLQKTQDYLIAQSQNGFTDLDDIDEKIKNRQLPFGRVNEKVFIKVSKKIFDPSHMRTVIVGNEINQQQ